MGEEGIPMGIVQETEIWRHEQLRCAESFLENETQKILWDFETQTEYLISARGPENLWRIEFAVPGEHRI